MKRLLIGVALALLVAAAIVYSSSGRRQEKTRPTETTTAQREMAVIIADGTPPSLDPLRLTDVLSGIYVSCVHAPLCLLGADGKQVMILADRVDMSPDGKLCTIHLREARFWDGSPVQASDVAYSFRRLHSHPQAALIFQRVKKAFEDYEIINDRTLLVHFDLPDPDFPLLISNDVCAVVKELPNDVPAREFDLQVVGAGPYQVENAKPGERFTFISNPGFPIKPDFPRLEIQVAQFEQAQIASIADGSADLVQLRGPILNDIVSSESDGSLKLLPRFASAKLLSKPSNENVVLFLSSASGALKKLTLDQRQNLCRALYSALPRQEVSTKVYLGTAQPAFGVVPIAYGGVQQPIYSDGVRPANVPRMKLLAANDADSRRLTEIVRAAVTPLGFEIEPTFVDLPTLASRLISGESTDIGLVWLEMNMSAAGPLPWAMFFSEDSPFTVLGERVEGLNTLLSDARSILDNAKRRASYEEILADLSRKQTAWIPFVSRNSTWLVSNRVNDDFLDSNGKFHVALLRARN